MISFTIGTILLVILDLWITRRRINTYGPIVELNLLAKELAAEQGVTAALIFLAMWNAAIIIGLTYYNSPTWMHVLFGCKLGLALFQLKSLQMESYIEKILHKARDKAAHKV